MIGGTAHAANSTYFFCLCFGQPAQSYLGPGQSGGECHHPSAGRAHLGTGARSAPGRSDGGALWQSLEKRAVCFAFQVPFGLRSRDTFASDRRAPHGYTVTSSPESNSTSE